MPRDYPRSRRIEDQIQRILSDLVQTEVRDPRLANAIITAVRVSKDLSVAWVYYSVLQATGDTENLDDAFASAMGFMRGRLAKDLTVRRVPELRFRLDETLSNARDMDQLIEAAMNDDRSMHNDADALSDDTDEQP